MIVSLTPAVLASYTSQSVRNANRGVAQSVARGVWDAEVEGSSPFTPTAQQTRGESDTRSAAVTFRLHPRG